MFPRPRWSRVYLKKDLVSPLNVSLTSGIVEITSESEAWKQILQRPRSIGEGQK